MMSYSWLLFCFCLLACAALGLCVILHFAIGMLQRGHGTMTAQNVMLGQSKRLISNLLAENQSLRDALVEARQQVSEARRWMPPR